MYQNDLTDRYNAYSQQPIQYMKNQMFTSNPVFTSNIYDPSFHQKMLMQREEQIRKVKNISDLGISKEQITEYVIAPLKIEKSDMRELERLRDESEKTLFKDFIEKNLWTGRTNAPYKTILKNQNCQREFKEQKDLIVHKFTKLDRIGLMDEYNDLIKVLERHNGDLKVIFSTSKKNEHVKAFKFVEKYRKRVKYNPKDYNELKEYHKKESQKFERDRRKLDMYIERINADDIDPKELKQLESELFAPQNFKSKKSKKKSKLSSVDKQLDDLMDELDEEDLLELESEVLKELENEEKQRKSSSRKTKKTENDSDDDSKSEENNRIKTKKYSSNNKITNDDDKSDKSRIRIVRRTIKTEEPDNDNKSSDAEVEDTKTSGRIRIKRIVRTDTEKNQEQHEESDEESKISNDGSEKSKTTGRVKIIRKTKQ